jgi:nucleoside-diphosphate-sugar epimerase
MTEEIVPPIEERTLPKRDLRENPYRILITGSNGFIGSYVKTFLESDMAYEGFIFDGLDLSLGQDLGDFTRPDIRYDCVIHLAAFADIRNSLDDPDRFWENNVEKARGVFKYCEVNNIRLLYASSAGAKEWWLNPYATTKKVNEVMAPYNSVGMRFFNVYREGRLSRTDMLYRMLEDKTATYLTRHNRDWIHVDDVARAIARIIPSTLTGVVDIGTGTMHSVIELAEAFGQGDLPIKEDTPGEPDTLIADTEKIRSIGWYPTYDVIESAKEWVQQNESTKLETPQQEGEKEET